MHPINNRAAGHSLLLTPNRTPLRSKSSFKFIHQTLSNMKISAYKQVIQKQASELIKKKYRKPLDSYIMQKQNKLATKKTQLIEQLLGSLNIVQSLQCSINPQTLDQIYPTHLISFHPFPAQKLSSSEQNGGKILNAQNQKYTFNQNQHCFELQQIYQKQNKGWLNPHKYFVLNSDLPCSVVKTFKTLNKNAEKPLNFVQGYLYKIDCLFYVLEKQLHICPPLGPSAVMFQKQYIFQLPDIVYSIIETKLSLDDMWFVDSETSDNNSKPIKNKDKDKGCIFVICHPYYIQLYYLVTPQKNKTFWDIEMNKNQIIHKLGLKYHLPDCSQPKHILLNKDSFYYFPDQSCVISKVCLKTGKNTKLSAGYQAHPYLTKSCKFFQQNNPNIAYIKQLSISDYFSQRMMKCILNVEIGGWLYSLATKYFIDIQVKKIMSCPHGTKIVCLFQRRFKQTINIQTRTNHQVYLKKQLIRIYQQNKNNVNQQVQWTYSDILYQNKQKIFDINLLVKSQKCKCDLELMVYLQQKRKVQFHCFPYRDNNNQGNFVRGSVQIFKQVQLPLVPSNPKYRKIQQVRCMKANPTTLLYHYPSKNVTNLFQMDYVQKISLKKPFTLPQQQYMYQNDGIITLATQSGYTRILRLSQIDWLYSIMKMFLKNNKMPQLSLKQLIKFIYNKLQEQHKSPQFSLIILLGDIVMVVNNLLKLILMADNGQTVNLWSIQQYGVKIFNNHEISFQIRDLCQKLVKQHKQFIFQTFLNNSFQFKKLIDYLLTIYKDNAPSVFKTQSNNKQNYLSSQFLNLLSWRNKEEKDMTKKSTNNLNVIIQIQKFWLKMQTKYQGCLLKPLIFNTSFSIAVADVLHQIWSLPISGIDCKIYEITLSNLDKLLVLWEMINQDSQQQYENVNLNYQTDFSPESTLAHSHPRTPKSITNIAIVQLIQILMVCWVTKNHLPLLTIQQANKQSINYFVSYLFKAFLQDFEPQLLTYWRKLFPRYLLQNYPNLSAMAPQNVRAQTFDYWLVFFPSICGISNKQKIIKVIINKFKGKEPIRQSELDVFYQIYKNQPKQRGKYKMVQYIVFPQFIIEYLIEKKNIYFSDIKLALHSDQLLQNLATTQDHKIYSNSTQLNKNTIKKDNEPIVKAFVAQDELSQVCEDKKLTNDTKKEDNNLFGILSAKMQRIKEVITHIPGLPFKKEGSHNNSKDSQVITY